MIIQQLILLTLYLHAIREDTRRDRRVGNLCHLHTIEFRRTPLLSSSIPSGPFPIRNRWRPQHSSSGLFCACSILHECPIGHSADSPHEENDIGPRHHRIRECQGGPVCCLTSLGLRRSTRTSDVGRAWAP